MKIHFNLVLSFALIGLVSVPVSGNEVSEVLQEPKLTISDFKKFRDPFKAPNFEMEEDRRSSLEKFSVNEFKLIAVMTGPVRMRAMIADPTGKTYSVAQSTPIGLRDGKVVKITTQSVVVREKIVNPLGEAESVDTEIGFAARP